MPGTFLARFAILSLDSLGFSSTLVHIELRFCNTHSYASNERAKARRRNCRRRWPPAILRLIPARRESVGQGRRRRGAPTRRNDASRPTTRSSGIITRLHKFERPQRGNAHCANRKPSAASLVSLARPKGVEPPTLGSEVRCSVQLSYGRALRKLRLFCVSVQRQGTLTTTSDGHWISNVISSPCRGPLAPS
jgi:hypothetical protein